MRSKKQEQRDVNILVGITGREDVSTTGVMIEDDYLAREARENATEQGELDIEETLGRNERERRVYHDLKMREELETERYEAQRALMTEHLEEEYDEEKEELPEFFTRVKI